MKTNPDKFHFFASLVMNTETSVSSFDIANTHSQKLLRVTIDRELNFRDQVFNLCKKASAISRVFPFMLLNQWKVIMRAILMTQFVYCPLVWMIPNRTLNNRINSLHERAFWLVYNEFKSSFYQLLEKDNSVTIHQCSLKTLAIEIFIVHYNIAPEIMKNVFEIKNHQYNFRRDVRLHRTNVNTVQYDTETIASLGAQMQNLVPKYLKCSRFFNAFKKKYSKMDCKGMSLSSMQSVCTKPRVYIKVMYTEILHV